MTSFLYSQFQSPPIDPPNSHVDVMCKTKSSTDVIAPTPRSSNRPSQSKSKSYTYSSSSSSSINFTTTNSNPNSKSSAASRTSLSSLRDSLPENPHIYPFSEIRSATNNFRSNKVSPSSWKSTVRGRDVVIFQRKLRRALDLDQLCERLSLVCRSHHSSIINLLGASVSANYIYLVYEFVSGANLVDCLRNHKNPSFTVLSTWLSRMQVATNLAHGLDYIHHFSGLNSILVHNHIKSSSIIVTEQQEESVSEPISAKFCHFGTAELCGEVGEIGGAKVKKIEGTRGYMSPEFQLSGIPTQNSDVYAFGVVILELLSGDEPLRFVVDEETGAYSRISVIERASQAMVGGGVRRWVDRRLRDSYPVEVAEKMVLLGLQCVDEDPNKRPNMRQVAVLVSRLFLESKTWAESIGLPIDFSVSLAPR